MRQIDLAYIAGFLDGEGCFYLQSNSKPAIACENTYRPIIDDLRRQFGGSVTKIEGKKKNHRPTYRWAMVSRDAVKVCEQIVVYLKEKQEQALILIAVGMTTRMPKQGTKLTKEVIRQRKRFDDRLRKLKGRL